MALVNEAFIEQLLIKADPNIDDEALDMMMDDIQPVLYERILTHIAKELDDKQMGTFADLIEKGGNEGAIYDFLIKTMPDYEKFIAKTYDDFETMYLKEFKNFEKEFPPEEKDEETK